MILDKLFDWFGSGPTIYKGPVKNLKFKLKLLIFVKFSLDSSLHCAVKENWIYKKNQYDAGLVICYVMSADCWY